MNSNPMMMSGAALPGAQPVETPRPAPGPQVVGPPEEHQRGGRGWIWTALVVVAAGAGYWAWTQQQAKQTQATAQVVRALPVKAGVLQRTLRLTGATTAEKYVTLIAPSMRGGRGGGSSVTMMGGGRGGGTMVVTVTSGGGDRGGSSRSSSGGSSAPSTLSSTSMSGNMLASTSGAAGGGGGSSSGFSGGGDSVSSSAGAGGSGLRSAASAAGRGGGSRTSSVASSSSRGARSSSGGAASATTGADGLGTTGGSLGQGQGPPGGGGGGSSRGGGMGDFMMQIQEMVANGSKVTKGQTVAEFDRQYMLLRLDDYKANVDQSENSMKASLANLEVTRKSYEQQIMAAKNTVAKAELDMRTLPVRSAIDSERLRLAQEEAKANLKQLEQAAKYVDIGERAQIKMSQLELDTTKLEYRRAEANADKMLVKAPIEGLAVMQNTFRGGEFGLIQQGDQVFPGQSFMQIVDPSSMVVTASVNQVDVQNLKLGQKAKMRFDAFPGLELPGHVVMIGAITKGAGSRASFKKDVAVRLKLDRMDPRVIPDLSVSADIILDETETAAPVVPLEALSAANSGPDGKSFVLVRTANGNWERREVMLGLASYTQVAVTSGLKEGEVVALEPPPATKAGGEPQPVSS